MIFSSPVFFVFFAAVLMLYAATTTYRQRAALLLAASILFYASWKPAYLVLLAVSLGVNYWIYRRLHQTRSKAMLVLGLVLNLALLGTVKYLAMAIETMLALSHVLGLEAPPVSPKWMDWALPLGISFYTFHMLSVMIDVYRGEWQKPIRFRIWCLYVTFFPHMIAGPILRASQLVDQLEDLKPLQAEHVRIGVMIFLAGLIKKILFADNLSGLVDTLYAHPENLGFYTAWAATLAFALQIYFDFSGYSEMAIGLARVFGVSLPRNFEYPYISRNPQEFWRRWHITLSRWLRDYLYFSLGGSRGSTVATYRNLSLTMLLGGLWHGANWTFVFWGGLHGLYLIGHRLLAEFYARTGLDQGVAARALSWLGWPTTFVLICFTWVFFRAASFGDAWQISSAMLGMCQPVGNEPELRVYVVLLLLASLALALLEPLLEKGTLRRLEWWWARPWLLRGAAYFCMAIVLIFFGGSTQKFIYFDF